MKYIRSKGSTHWFYVKFQISFNVQFLLLFFFLNFFLQCKEERRTEDISSKMQIIIWTIFWWGRGSKFKTFWHSIWAHFKQMLLHSSFLDLTFECIMESNLCEKSEAMWNKWPAHFTTEQMCSILEMFVCQWELGQGWNWKMEWKLSHYSK